MKKKRAERKPKNLGEAVGFQHIYKNEKVDFILGIVLLSIALYVIIAMVSYFSTGKTDQSILENLQPMEWLNTDRRFTNYCGSIGAIVSYNLMTVNFGIPAFFIPTFIILVGLRLMRVYQVNLWKWFLGMAVVMIWSSVSLAKFATPFMGNLVFNPGGNHGLFCVQQLENLVGSPGLTAILFLVMVGFLTYISAETIIFIRKALNPVKYLSKKIPLTITNLMPQHQNDEAKTEEIEEETIAEEPAQKPIQDNPNVVDLTNFSSFNQPKEKKKAEQKTETEETDNASILTVEVAQRDEKATNTTFSVEEVLKTPINPKEPFLKYKYPTLDLLKKYSDDEVPQVDMEEIEANNNRIIEVLNSFGVEIRGIKATVGPTITLYEITPGEGQRISKIRNLEDDIALSLSALGIRIIAPIPGKGTIGIEVPNKKPSIVSMESILNSKKYQESTMELPLAIGKTITNEVFMVDLAKIPHLLVAGATGQGKSVGLNAIITSLLYKKHPNELKIVLIDPKKVEFSVYAPIADHFMAAAPGDEEEPIMTDVSKVVRTLNSLCTLMDHRYDLLKLAGARNIKEYNKKFVNHQLNLTKGHEYMPYIVVIIDEFGDLIMTAGREIESPITRIAQLARAVGIHMVIATQRPTTTIITGNIKANFPGRMAFKVSAMIDSRTILDRQGANQLVGRGDMLFLNGNDPVRVQCAFVDTPEIDKINQYIVDQPGPVAPLELPEPLVAGKENGISNGGSGDLQSLDPFFEEAALAIVTSGIGSTSMIQRRFSIGYNRAGRLMDQLEAAGIVGPTQGSKPRDVLVQDETSLSAIFEQIRS